MTTSLCPSVFDAGLPTLQYEFEEPPAQVYPRIRAAQAQAPIALGPYGPEILTHELVRTVLRDPRFTIPPGMTLMAHGIRRGRCGTRSPTACLVWRATPITGSAAWCRRLSPLGRARGCTTRSST